ELKGTGSGTFTLNVDEFHADDHIIGTTFKDIPVSTTTNIKLDIQTNINSLSSMRLDMNGDGIVDYNLAPKLNDIVTAPYRFDGFLQPINDTAHQIGQNLSVFKAGSSVPVKLQLRKIDGTVTQGIQAPLWLSPQKGSVMNASVDESVYTDAA